MRVATNTRIWTDEEHQPYSLEAQELGAQIRELRCREEELELASSQSSSIQVDDSHITDVHDAHRESIEGGGTPQQKKALLKALIAEIRVDGNEAAPLYRLPHPGFVLWERWWAAVDSNHLPPRWRGPCAVLRDPDLIQNGRRYRVRAK